MRRTIVLHLHSAFVVVRLCFEFSSCRSCGCMPCRRVRRTIALHLYSAFVVVKLCFKFSSCMSCEGRPCIRAWIYKSAQGNHTCIDDHTCSHFPQGKCLCLQAVEEGGHLVAPVAPHGHGGATWSLMTTTKRTKRQTGASMRENFGSIPRFPIDPLLESLGSLLISGWNP